MEINTEELKQRCIFNQLKDPQFCKGLKKLVLRNKGLKQLKGEQLFNIPNVQIIEIVQNKVYDLTKLSKISYQHLLSYLVENNTQLKIIPFLDSPNIQKIFIKNKQRAKLTNIEYFSKGTYKKLKLLRLQNTTFDSIDLSCCQSLEQLILINNRIQQLKNPFNKFGENLIHIILQKSRILLLPQVIKGQKLKTFNISQNFITSIQFFQKSPFPQLVQIIFNNNRVKSLPSIEAPKLQKIVGNDNLIIQIDRFATKQYPFLVYMNLNQNRITHLPTLNCPQLINLMVEYNKLKIIHKSVLSQLKFLSLGHNKLTIFPPIQMVQLQVLGLVFNEIKIIDQAYFPKLQQLNMEQNQLQDIEGLSKHIYPQLHFCMLKRNEIKNIPALKFPKIIQMVISQNPLNSIQSLSDQTYPNLKILNLSYVKVQHPFNGIYHLSLPVLKMPAMQNLYLDSSCISDFDEFFKGEYPSLKILDISGNNMIEQLPILNAPKLQSIRISKIWSIKKFLTGYYPHLRQIGGRDLSMDFLYGYNGQQSCFQQLICQYETKQKIITLPPIQTIQLRDYFQKNLVNIKLNLNFIILKSTQFISFLNLESIQCLSIKNNHYSSFMKNLTKLNPHRLKSLKKISINQLQNPNMIQFSVKNSLSGFQQQGILNIMQKNILIYPYERQMKRLYGNINSIYYEIIFSCKRSVFNYDSRVYKQFEDFLIGTKLREVRKEMRLIKK